MDIRNCKICGKLFNYVPGGYMLCPSCEKTLEEKFQEVKQFVTDNPGANINEVSEKMDITVSQIKRWIREERLTFSQDSMVMLDCERCGAPIRSGRFCTKCKEGLQNQLSNAIKRNEPTMKKKNIKDANAKMRFLS